VLTGAVVLPLQWHSPFVKSLEKRTAQQVLDVIRFCICNRDILQADSSNLKNPTLANAIQNLLPLCLSTILIASCTEGSSWHLF